MERSVKNQIMLQLYKLETEMDRAINSREDAIEHGDNKRAEACQRIIDCLSFQYQGMTNAIKAFGYKLIDDDGCWKIERRFNHEV